MSCRASICGALASVVLVSLPLAFACVRKPAPATPGPASSHRAADSGGPHLGPLYFDPQGADFTVWINHFKNEVYRNWIVPQAALVGANDHVDFEFTVERSGSMSGLRLLRPSGSSLLDEAARNAITSSQFTVLPKEYTAARVTMQVTFFYRGLAR